MYLNCNYGKGLLKSQKQNKRHKGGAWALATTSDFLMRELPWRQAFMRLIKKRPCTVPWCVSVSVFVPLVPPYWAFPHCIHRQAEISLKPGLSLRIEHGPAVYPNSVTVIILKMTLHWGFLGLITVSSLTLASWLPWFGQITMTTSCSLYLCMCCQNAVLLREKSGSESQPNAYWSLLIQ